MNDRTGGSLTRKPPCSPRTFRQLVRSLRDRVLESTAPTLAERLYRLSDRIARLPFRREVVDIPEPLIFDGRRVEIVADLAEYTQLPEDQVRAALGRRSGLSFRNEWWSTPARLRRDHWFYLSSKSYLFGNAVHFPDPTFPELVVLPFVPTDATVLDFGGGAGGLTLMLAAHGLETWYSDVNVLQRDFVRFRIRKHRLEDRIK